MGTLPRLPFMIFERTGVAGHHSLVRDDLAYCDMVTDRQQRACDIVREHHVLTVSRVERRTSALSDALTPAPKFAVGGWVWVYNTDATIRNFPNPKQLWWGGACEPHDGPNADNAGQRAPKEQG